MIKKKFNKRGEEDTGKPIPFTFEILVIIVIAVLLLAYFVVRIYNAFLPK